MWKGSHHQISITGRIIKDIELFLDDHDISTVKLSIPTNNVFKDELGNIISQETTWFIVILTESMAEITARTLKRGDHIQIVGRMRPEVKVREMKNGRIVGEYEVIADQVIFLQAGFKNDG